MSNRDLASTRSALERGLRPDAALKARRLAQRNPLRRVFLPCHGWVQDSVAEKGDHVWCSGCDDWARVTDVVA
jgi:hypothetical protein